MSERGYVRRRCKTCGLAIGSTDTACPNDHRVGREGGWTFVLDVTPKGGKRKRISKGGFRTKGDAERALSVLEQERRDGTYIEESEILTGAYLARWVKGVDVRESTRASYESHVRLHLIPALGDVPLQSLDRPTIKRTYAELKSVRTGEPLNPRTRHHVHITLRKALQDAVEDGLLRKNPADRAHKEPNDRHDFQVWTDSQVADFLRSVADDRLFALWRLALFSGARRGELIGLKWDDIDLAQGLVTFRRQISKQGDQGATEGPIKTERGNRTIDIDDTTIDALIAWSITQGEERRELEDNGIPYGGDGWVFTREKSGDPLDPDGTSSRWNRLVKASGLKRLKLHEARDTHATLLLKAGVPTHVVSRRLGHASEGFTLRVYAGVIPGQQQEAASRLSALIDGPGSANTMHGGVSTASDTEQERVESDSGR